MGSIKLFPKIAKDTNSRIEIIGNLVEKAEYWQKAVVKDPAAIKALADEMKEFGLIKAARMLLECING